MQYLTFSNGTSGLTSTCTYTLSFWHILETKDSRKRTKKIT